MCGISGILAPGQDRIERDRRVAAMTRALAHRGPDAEGSFSDADVALGFRRLAVIDPETGHQPIRLEDDRAVIVLNGEIYNFRELRREIEPRQRFRTRGDVEVVLRLYAEEGIACLARLNGMFALALWDRTTRTLVLARDRFGIKPLFFCRAGRTVAFASELAALLAGGFPDRMDLDLGELHHFLSQRYVSPRGTILRGVRSLAPATVLAFGADGGESESRYWVPPRFTARSAPAEELEATLATAVARQLVADVPVGVFLSGGVDSGTLTALVRRAQPGPLPTFSIGFTGPGAVSEISRARAAARQLGTEHHELTLEPQQVAMDLEAILSRLDGPLGDATCIPVWYLSRLARSRVTVALSGEGADELFGGYPRQRFDVWIDRLGPAGRRLLSALLAASGRSASRLRPRLAMASGPERFLDWSRAFTRVEIEQVWASGPPLAETNLVPLHPDLARCWDELALLDPINARLEADRIGFLPGDLLAKVDRMSMAHSLEVRVPYLDNAVVDQLLALPGRDKVGLWRDKVPLRALAGRVLPLVARRRKLGFEVPITAWLRGPLRPALTDLLAADAVRRRGLFHAEAVSRLLREHLEGRADHGQRLWSLLALEGWMRLVLDPVRQVEAA